MSMNARYRTILAATILGEASLFYLIISIWTRTSSLTTYIFCSLALSVILAFLILYSDNHKTSVFLIFLVSMVLTNMYFIFTHFSVTSPGDVTMEYAVINTFAAEDHLFVIESPPDLPWYFSSPLNRMTWYSSWPAFYSFSVVLSDISGVDPYHIVMVLPSFFMTLKFLFVYLFTVHVVKDFSLDKRVIPVSLLIFVFLPESLYFNFKFVRQNLAIGFFVILVYICYRICSGPNNRQYTIFFWLFSGVLVITHHLTSFIYVLYLLLLVGLSLILQQKYNIDIKITRTAVRVLAVMAVFILVFWGRFSSLLTGSIKAGIKNIFSLSFSESLHNYPSELRPLWVTMLLHARDVVICAGFVAGTYLLVRQFTSKKDKNKSLLAFILVSLISCFLIFCALFVSNRDPLRVLALGIQVFSFVFCLSFFKLRKKVVSFFVLVLIGISGFTGLWGHQYAPLHFYSDSVPVKEVEGFLTFDIQKIEALDEFFGTFTVFDHTQIISDGRQVFLVLDPENYSYVFNTTFFLDYYSYQNVFDEGGRIIVIQFNVGFYTHFNPKENSDKLLNSWEKAMKKAEKGDKIYDSGFQVILWEESSNARSEIQAG